MKILLILCAVTSMAVGATPKKPIPPPKAPDPIETISKADILATLNHQHELNLQIVAELNAGHLEVVKGLKVELTTAQGQVRAVQAIIDAKNAQIAADALKIARYHRLLRIVCTILAAVAAYLAFELMKPPGLFGLTAAYPVARWLAPIVVFGIVFGAAWAYF